MMPLGTEVYSSAAEVRSKGQPHSSTGTVTFSSCFSSSPARDVRGNRQYERADGKIMVSYYRLNSYSPSSLFKPVIDIGGPGGLTKREAVTKTYSHK